MTGTLDSRRIRSTCRVTSVFFRIELSWVRKVVIWTPKSLEPHPASYLPGERDASRLSARDNPKDSAGSSPKEKFSSGSARYDHGQGASIGSHVGAGRRDSQDIGRVTIVPSDAHASDCCPGFLLRSRCGDNRLEPLAVEDVQRTKFAVQDRQPSPRRRTRSAARFAWSDPPVAVGDDHRSGELV